MSVTSTDEDRQRDKPTPVTAAEAFAMFPVCEGIGCIVTAGRSGAPNDHQSHARDADFPGWAESRAAKRKPAYFTPATFRAGSVRRYEGRAQVNVQSVPGFWIDVEGTEAKGGYEGQAATLKALGAFCSALRVTPNLLVTTGGGGVHAYFILAEPLSVGAWLPRARRLVAVAAKHGFKIDAQCTTDAARIMRAPGSLHQKTDKAAQAYRWRVAPYTLAEWDDRTDYAPEDHVADAPASIARGAAVSAGINADVLTFPQFSYRQAATQCAAMRHAGEGGGRDTPYPVWILALRTADLSTEGRAFAHEISSAHVDYSEDATETKLATLSGGPAGCDAWAAAWGRGGPCDTCEYRTKIKNPAVQLGSVPDVMKQTLPAPAGQDAAVAVPEEGAAPVEWVARMNARYALVRVGAHVCVADFEYPTMTAAGIVRRIGFIETSTLRSELAGQFAPPHKADERPRPLADAWLQHRDRRQYASLVFDPSEASLPADTLNLWQGWAVEPAAGDVGPWLSVLDALVPDRETREYVLRWLAWKVQNPGGVPDTVLIFTGAKGTGKNSLFEPLLHVFGKHAMLADDPELIAGRFTWHLMYLALAVLDEAIFAGDPRQADRIKSRVTAKIMHYERKGADPVPGVNRCAYVMLTNHSHVWQATHDERRAVIVETGDSLRGDLDFWTRYHAWCAGEGPAALLHYLKHVDLGDFNPRAIPRGEALRRQIEQTSLRDPAVAWWHQCLTEGCIRWNDGMARRLELHEDAETQVSREVLRMSYEQSAGARGRAATDWATAARKLKAWYGDEWRKVRGTCSGGGGREYRDVLPDLRRLRARFAVAVGVPTLDVLDTPDAPQTRMA
jgi:hypothetical protein